MDIPTSLIWINILRDEALKHADGMTFRVYVSMYEH
jgi:hypothetical protein